jgi:anthranilate synthase component 1
MSRFVPDFEAFQQLAKQGNMVPIYRQLVADTLTPLTAYSQLQWGDSSFLFESVVGGEQVGRFSFLGSDPFLQFEVFGNEVVITRDGVSESHTSTDPLGEFEQLVSSYEAPHLPGLPRFCGGAVGYFGYDVVRYTEHLPNAPADDRQLPDLAFAFYDRMVIFDQIRKTILVVVNSRTTGADLRVLYDRACERIDETCRQLQRGTANLQLTDINVKVEPRIPWKSNFTRAEFEQSVAKCQEYIRAGDIFQVVISQRLQLETSARPIDIYRALRIVNPSPFMFLLRTPRVNLVGASPEIMVRVEEGEVTIRPLAGTRRRGQTEEEDLRLEQELLADPKERAEHVMLIDLARNDIGRIAQIGSVKVTEAFVVERYSHVMHIVSNVEGMLNEGMSNMDVLKATFPAGTLTGAPKVHAMELIDQFEPVKRGIYGGACGYISYAGDMDVAIAIRTAVIKDQMLYVQAAAGVVADSVPEMEWRETEHKARALLRASELVEEGLE